VDVIATAMTKAQKKILAPSTEAVPLSESGRAHWTETEEGRAAEKAEQKKQPAAVEKEWGPQRWGA
jgi:hypothetical protein